MSVDKDGNKYRISVRYSDGTSENKGCSSWSIQDGVLQIYKRVNFGSGNQAEKMVAGYPFNNMKKFEVTEL